MESLRRLAAIMFSDIDGYMALKYNPSVAGPESCQGYLGDAWASALRYPVPVLEEGVLRWRKNFVFLPIFSIV